MKNGRLQCKDIPTRPILDFLAKQTAWTTYGTSHHMPTVQDAMPPDTPSALQLAKMAQLIRAGLVDGCDCGCRGDFELTNKGIAVLADQADAR